MTPKPEAPNRWRQISPADQQRVLAALSRMLAKRVAAAEVRHEDD
jgi:hypothetical protein